MMIVGVDPGQTGALVLLESDGTFVTAAPMPGFGAEPSAADFEALLEAMGTNRDLFVAIEEPFANNRASSIAQLNQGIGFGILLGVVGALGYRHERIKPAQWKRDLGLPMSKDLTYAQKKKNSRIWASRLWPAEADRWAKTNSDGIAEAALIGESCRRRIVGSVA